MRRALCIYTLGFLAAFLCAGCIWAQSAKTETSARKAAKYVAQKLCKEHKGEELLDDLEEMMAGLMLACTLPPEPVDLEEDEQIPDSDDQNATRRDRRNRRQRDKQRRDRQRDKRSSRTDSRRVRTRYRTRRRTEDDNESAA